MENILSGREAKRLTVCQNCQKRLFQMEAVAEEGRKPSRDKADKSAHSEWLPELRKGTCSQVIWFSEIESVLEILKLLQKKATETAFLAFWIATKIMSSSSVIWNFELNAVSKGKNKWTQSYLWQKIIFELQRCVLLPSVTGSAHP